MLSSYQAFFAASAGASAAFIGLMFVALSFIDSAKANESTKAWRRIIASSAYAQLVDIFFVSLAGLLPDPHNVALVGCVMASLGLVVAIRLLPQTVDRSKSGRGAPTILGLVAVGAYVLQLVTGVILLHNPSSQSAVDYFIVAMLMLYAGALARAWEITGIKRR